MNRYFDIHSHLHFSDYDLDRGELVSSMEKSGIFSINIGTDIESSKQAVALAEKSPNLFASIGLHPGDNKKEIFSSDYESLVKNEKVVAIGECGLDYFRLDAGFETEEKTRQKKEFEKQIIFAIENNKPLMLHIRDAYSDALSMLESYKKQYGEKLRGNSHFFAGDIEVAKKFLDLDFSMSFTGVLTFARNYDEVVNFVPISNIMSETDAPYVAPAPFRGKRNEPAYVSYVVKAIAEIKKQKEDEVVEILFNNALKFFNIHV